MELQPLLKEMIDARASDIFVVAGRPLTYSAGGSLKQIGDKALMPEEEGVSELERYVWGQQPGDEPVEDESEEGLGTRN